MERPWDMIDEIAASVGKIRLERHARAGTAGYYTEAYRQAVKGPAKVLFSATGQVPDEVADSLREARLLPQDASVDDLWDGFEVERS